MTIVVLDGFTLNPGDNSWAPLEELGDVRVYDRSAPAEVRERAAEADILLTNKTPLPQDIILSAPRLKFISVLATGYNIVDIAALAESFGMHVIYNTRTPRPDSPQQYRTLQQLFAEADVVSLHCALTPENTGIVNGTLLERMKPSAFLINTARGALINEGDLSAALNSG
jgi:phosphoglycerate dehydrogenase-like enzyme